MVTALLLEKAAVFQEGFTEIVASSDLGGGPSDAAANGVEVLADELGHVGPCEMTPEVFDRIQFGSVRRQVLDRQPRDLSGEMTLHVAASVSREAIPQQYDLAIADMPLQSPQVRDDLRLLDRSAVQAKAQADAACRRGRDQAGDCRGALPVEWSDQDRRATAGRPGALHAGGFRKAAFVEKYDQRSGLTGLFLIRGQRWRIHLAIASSSRSRARCSGR